MRSKTTKEKHFMHLLSFTLNYFVSIMSANDNKNNQQQQAHINPFYIDPGELEMEWQGDYEWEDEYEAEGLLLNNNENHHSRSSSPRQSSTAASSKKKAAAFSNSNRQQLPHVKGGVRLSRGQKRWICIIVFFALLIFFILSFTDNNSNKNTNADDNVNHNNNNDGVETTLKSDDAHTNSYSNDENNHDNNNKNNAVMNGDDAVVDEPTPPRGEGNSNNNGNDPSSYVHRVVLLGERQTGVDAFRKHWADCFPTRNFTTVLTRKTFWFQDLAHPPHDVINNKDQERIFFVLLVRNPYTWVEAMRTHPLYMSAHVNQTTHKALSWQDFVTQPWRPILTTSMTETDTATTCQLDFAPNQVMPCHVPDSTAVDDAHHPDVYELKPAVGDGADYGSVKNDLAFANILALRAAKLQHFISNLPQAYQDFNLMATLPLKSALPIPETTSMSHLIDNNVLIIHYEDDLVTSMQKFEQVTGFQPVETCHQAKRLPPTITLENLDPEFIRYLSRDNNPDDGNTGLLNWELETLIGYQKVVL